MITVGIDEVGRGCWAGPLVAGAVILGKPVDGLADSKALTKKQRERLAAEIYVAAEAWGIGWVSPSEIDEIGLTSSIKLAMRRALGEIHMPFDWIIIDGNYNFLPEFKNSQAIIKADMTVPAVSASSIIAKVARDKFMAEASLKFPNYQFDKHVGYGTALHRELLAIHGICELHRLSYKPIQALML